MRDCSANLVKITYQLPTLMSTKISSVILATASPCAHSAPRPYGLSTAAVSELDVEALAGVPTAAVAARAVAAAGPDVGTAVDVLAQTAPQSKAADRLRLARMS